MATQICLIRGINVGGRNTVRMQELKELCASLGFTGVESYLQSGNLVLDAGRRSPSTVAATMREGILDRFGVDVPVVVRRPREMEEVVRANPFQVHDHIDPKKLHVVFLSGPMPDDAALRIESLGPVDEEFAVVGQHIFLHCPSGYARTRLGNTALERCLETSATTRNWKTVRTVAEMAASR